MLYLTNKKQLKIICFSFQTITDEQKHKAAEHATACAKEIGVQNDTATKLSSGDFSLNDEKTQCFAKCFMEKAGFLDNQGKLQDDVIISKLSKSHDENKVSLCKHV